MAEIRHGGGCRTVPFLEVVRCGRFFGDRARAKKFRVFTIPSFYGWYSFIAKRKFAYKFEFLRSRYGT